MSPPPFLLPLLSPSFHSSPTPSSLIPPPLPSSLPPPFPSFPSSLSSRRSFPFSPRSSYSSVPAAAITTVSTIPHSRLMDPLPYLHFLATLSTLPLCSLLPIHTHSSLVTLITPQSQSYLVTSYAATHYGVLSNTISYINLFM